jgi:hypothetical protein
VRRESTTVDPWAELERQRELVSGDLAEVENTPFTLDEQTQMAGLLREINNGRRRTTSRRSRERLR